MGKEGYHHQCGISFILTPGQQLKISIYLKFYQTSLKMMGQERLILAIVALTHQVVGGLCSRRVDSRIILHQMVESLKEEERAWVGMDDQG